MEQNKEEYKGSEQYNIKFKEQFKSLQKQEISNISSEINEITYNQIASVDTILQGIERKERAKVINDCLLKLPEEERSLIWMFYFDELSLKEIIEVTQISEANLKVKLHRARKKLLIFLPIFSPKIFMRRYLFFLFLF